MNLNHLSLFHAVAVEGSVSRAATRMTVSQPAVSKLLSVFERSVNTRLMERLPRGVRLTEAGEILKEYADKIFALEAEATSALADLHGMRRGRLRIGASTTIGVYLLPDPFVRFRRENSEIDAQFDVIGSAAVERRLLLGDLDLGFTESFSGTKDLEANVFRNDELVAIVARNHPLARKRRVTIERFCAEPFVVRETGSESRSFVERALECNHVSVKPVMSLPSTEAIKRAVAAGVGVAIVSRNAIELELQAKRLAVVKIAEFAIKRPLYVLRRSNSEPSPAAQVFMKLIACPSPN